MQFACVINASLGERADIIVIAHAPRVAKEEQIRAFKNLHPLSLAHAWSAKKFISNMIYPAINITTLAGARNARRKFYK